MVYDLAMSTEKATAIAVRDAHRPTLLTRAKADRLREVVAIGNYLTIACRQAGVAYSTYQRWRARGEKERAGDESTVPLSADESDYVYLLEQIEEGLAEAEANTVEIWQAAMSEDWRAAAEFLARRFPQRWAKQSDQRGAGNGLAVAAAVSIELKINLGGHGSKAYRYPVPTEDAEAVDATFADINPEEDEPDDLS